MKNLYGAIIIILLTTVFCWAVKAPVGTRTAPSATVTAAEKATWSAKQTAFQNASTLRRFGHGPTYNPHQRTQLFLNSTTSAPLTSKVRAVYTTGDGRLSAGSTINSPRSKQTYPGRASITGGR